MRVGSVGFLSFSRGQNAQRFPVLSDRSPGYVNVVLLEHVRNLLVAVRFCPVFRFDDVPEVLLDRLGRNRFSVEALDGAVEKVLEFEDALRRMDVFVGSHTADGGFVHFDVFRHVPQHQRLKVSNAFVQEVLLKVDDAVGDPVDGPLPLMNALDQPSRGLELVLDILFGAVL